MSRGSDINVSVTEQARDVRVVVDASPPTVLTQPTQVTPVVTTVIDPVDITVRVEQRADFNVIVETADKPVVFIEPTEIPIVGSAILGPQGKQGDQGIQGEQGIPGATGATFIHNQLAPAQDWTVVHDMNKFPSVMVVDSGETVVEPDIRYDSITQLTISFGSPTSGKAYLN